MTEVIRVSKDRGAGEAIPATPADTDSEVPQSTEVIRVIKRSGTGESSPGSAPQVDSERPQAKKVVAGPNDPEAARAVTEKAGNVAGDIAAMAAVFSDSLRALDLVAAEQARWLVGVATSLAEAARSSGTAGSLLLGETLADSEIEAFLSGLKHTADTQMRALTNAQARLAEMAAGRQQDSHSNPGYVSSGKPAATIDATIASIASNLNLAQQNAVAHQQSMNEIAQTAIAAGLSLLFRVSA